MMNTFVNITCDGLAEVIDEITNAKSFIKLDTNDFADMLQTKGETVVISVEEQADKSIDFSIPCNEVSVKLNEVAKNRIVRALVLYISHPKDYTIMMDDMNQLDIIFGSPQLKEVSTKCGLGENNNKAVKLITILKLAE